MATPIPTACTEPTTLESESARPVYGVRSAVNGLLIINAECGCAIVSPLCEAVRS